MNLKPNYFPTKDEAEKFVLDKLDVVGHKDLDRMIEIVINIFKYVYFFGGPKEPKIHYPRIVMGISFKTSCKSLGILQAPFS